MSLWKITVFIGFVTVATIRKLLKYKRKCPSKALLDGKTVLITGANSGLGKSTAMELARRNARIILACRSLSSAEKTAKQIVATTGNDKMIPKELDLASMKSIREFCKTIVSEENDINILINNAGVFQCPYLKTEDGFEMQMGVNHFGHFLLTNLLLDKLKKTRGNRIIIVSSSLHKRGSIMFDDINCERSYRRSKAYADSKLANLLFAHQLTKVLDGSGVDVLALHPGMASTKLSRHVLSSLVAFFVYPVAVILGLRDSEEGSQSIIYCSVAPELTGQSGTYISKDCQPFPWSSNASDDHSARKLWKLSEKMTKLV